MRLPHTWYQVQRTGTSIYMQYDVSCMTERQFLGDKLDTWHLPRTAVQYHMSVPGTCYETTAETSTLLVSSYTYIVPCISSLYYAWCLHYEYLTRAVYTGTSEYDSHEYHERVLALLCT